MTKKTHPWLAHYPEKPDWNLEIPNKTMLDAFDETTRKHPDKTAMDFMGKTYSWGDFQESVNRFACGLQKHNIRKGDKVGLFLPNCPLFLIAYYGILKCGATVVNYNPLYSSGELKHQIEDSETKIMVTLDLSALYPMAHRMLEESSLDTLIIGKFTDMLSFPKNVLFPLLKAKDQAKPDFNDPRIHRLDTFLQNEGACNTPDLDPKNDVALLQYTGGTTGTPKGAMLTHRNLYANALQCLVNFPDEQDHYRMLGILPMFHVFAMTVTLNLPVLAGFEIVTIPRFDLKQALKAIHKKKPHFMAGVPAIFNAMNNCDDISSYDLSSLQFCISGGAPLPVEVKKSFEKKTGCVVCEGYGLTESSPVTNVNPPFGENIPGSIGMPVPATIIEIIDKDDKVTPMPLGERGELCVRGPQVMKGYWQNEEATNETLRPTGEGDVRLHTGDIAIMDEKGYVYIVDRIKDMIITNGYNVYPRNIEEAIYAHDAVEECIVAGLPHEERGEIVKAWIKLKNGKTLNEKDLLAFLEDRLSRLEMPKLIEFRDEALPKTMIGKLSRKDIVAEETQKQQNAT
ncbi:MAG: dicarboxylate--CoA ligase PimA [Micavibrio sp.]|nr:dicarboxylate--CoA ligase PimA [Micavibrio sp.]|tara:strand:+ start:978 stop:2684 length:1707 start_codon:yes stop_codon:yes gene_type:complete